MTLDMGLNRPAELMSAAIAVVHAGVETQHPTLRMVISLLRIAGPIAPSCTPHFFTDRVNLDLMNQKQVICQKWVHQMSITVQVSSCIQAGELCLHHGSGLSSSKCVCTHEAG